MKHTNYEIRSASHPDDAKKYDTERIRKEYLVSNIFEKDKINLVYSDYDRFIVGGAFPVNNSLELETIDPLKASNFLDRREMGIINIGGEALVKANGTDYKIGHREAIYLGMGTKDVTFSSADKSNPAKLYINSAPAHKEFPVKQVTLADAVVAEMGSLESSNKRKINKLLVNGVVDTNQLQMGMTQFEAGSVWNTMPAHTHGRRMEAYFYFEVPDDQAICHFMGQPKETRHIWLQNEQAVISPNWSLHAGVGTAQYTFIWGMAGENLDYGDMDTIKPSDLR